MLPLFPKRSSLIYKSTTQSYNPSDAWTTLVWAFPVSLATTKGITFVFFSYGYLDVSVPHVCLLLAGCQAFNLTGCPIRKSADEWLFAPTRSLSQLITSFFASESLGIHHSPLFSFSLYFVAWSMITAFATIIQRATTVYICLVTYNNMSKIVWLNSELKITYYVYRNYNPFSLFK